MSIFRFDTWFAHYIKEFLLLLIYNSNVDIDTIQKLVVINKDFYKTVAAYFDSTRHYIWRGWEDLLPFLNHARSLRILDIGCGNGRFGLFLKDNISSFNARDYTGIDFDSFLLEKASQALPQASFIQANILDFSTYLAKLTQVKYDAIAIFGVLHHIPSYRKRLELLKNFRNLLADSGRIFFSTWEFPKASNFVKSTVSWETAGINPTQLEEGDYLLLWSKGVKAVRYCHYISQDEAKKLCSDAGLKIDKTYKSGTKGDEDNRYFIAGV
jgi:2-polyprenyl-3-methyl-5-hydroxy-6-metoxy-1,4-benzoquinol methylase